MTLVYCKYCGKDFKRKASQIKRAKEHFCSTFCQHESRKSGEAKKCFVCNRGTYRQRKFLKQSQSGKFFCSKKCSLKWQNTEFVGEKHPNWVNGEYSYRALLKKAKIVQECSLCGKDDQRILVVHHVDKNRQNNIKGNLTWLCHNCHHLVHHYVKKEFLPKIRQNDKEVV